MPLEGCGRDTQHLSLGIITVGHETTIQHRRTTDNLSQHLADPASGTGLGGHQPGAGAALPATLTGDAASRLQRQREVYREVVGVCVAQPRCDAVTFWGFTDAHSWIDEFFGEDDPLLFDAQYQAKPAFFGVDQIET